MIDVSPGSDAGGRASQRVASVRNVNEGPRAGFLVAVVNMEAGFEDFTIVLELMT